MGVFLKLSKNTKLFTTLRKKLLRINKHNRIYIITSCIGLIYRVVLLPIFVPNFFELVFPFLISWNMPEWLYQITLRIFLLIIDVSGIAIIFHLISFGTVGLLYKKYSDPSWGSILYNIFYTIYTLIATLLICFFYWWVILIIFLCYILICYLLYNISASWDCAPEKLILYMIGHLFLTVTVFVALLTINLIFF